MNKRADSRQGGPGGDGDGGGFDSQDACAQRNGPPLVVQGGFQLRGGEAPFGTDGAGKLAGGGREYAEGFAARFGNESRTFVGRIWRAKILRSLSRRSNFHQPVASTLLAGFNHCSAQSRQ